MTGDNMIYNNKLDSCEIYKYINKNVKINKIYLFDEINSTNEFGKAINSNDGYYDLVISNCQTNGKGRLGRSFYSPSNTGIYMSIVFSHLPNSFNFVNITSITAVAVTKAIEELTGLNIGIKWVNDLYFNDKKIAGILVEGITNSNEYITSKIIVGIGINLSTDSFPEELIDIAGSLNSEISKNMLIAYIVNYFDYYFKSSNYTYLDIYKNHSIIIGKDIIYYKDNIPHYGKAIDINNNSELVVLDSEGIINVLRTGEISIRVKK